MLWSLTCIVEPTPTSVHTIYSVFIQQISLRPHTHPRHSPSINHPKHITNTTTFEYKHILVCGPVPGKARASRSEPVMVVSLSMSIPVVMLPTYDHGFLIAARAGLAAAGARRNLEGICRSGRQYTVTLLRVVPGLRLWTRTTHPRAPGRGRLRRPRRRRRR